MAEKEEKQKRLLIKEYDLVCDLNDCKYCEEKDWCSEKDGITRQEAIERIVKAFVNLYIEIEGTGVTYTAKEAAEAALNALLEVEK